MKTYLIPVDFSDAMQVTLDYMLFIHPVMVVTVLPVLE